MALKDDGGFLDRVTKGAPGFANGKLNVVDPNSPRYELFEPEDDEDDLDLEDDEDEDNFIESLDGLSDEEIAQRIEEDLTK